MKLVKVKFMNKDGKQSRNYYDYLTDIEDLQKGDLVFVEKSGWGEDIAEVISYKSIFHDDIKYKQVVERVEVIEDKVYLRGEPAHNIFDEKIKWYKKKKSFFSRLLGK